MSTGRDLHVLTNGVMVFIVRCLVLMNPVDSMACEVCDWPMGLRMGSGALYSKDLKFLGQSWNSITT